MAPDGWNIEKVSNLIKTKDIIGVQDGNHGNDHPKSSDYVTSGIPFVMARDLKHGVIDTKTCSFIKKEQADTLRIGFAKPGDVLLSHKGTIGATAIVPEGYDYIMLTPQVTYYRVNKNGRLDRDYLFHYFNGAEYQEKLNNLASQSTRNYLGITAQKELLIKLPPLQEQKKIAQILSTWDKAITNTELLIANSQQQKKALMQQLLTGKKRLLDKNGVRFSGEWHESNLKKLLSISKGQQLNRNTLSKSGEFPVINGGIEPSGFTSIHNTEANTITISEGGNSCGYVGFQTKRFWCGGHCYAIQDIKLDLSFTYQLLKFSQTKIMRLRVGSGLPNIQKKDLEALRVRYPVAPEEQHKIASVLSTADQVITALQNKLGALKKEKKALMQQLLTGKLRVKIEDKEVA